MKTNTVTFRKILEGALADTCQRVIEKMENNPVFPNPPAALAELKALLPEYSDAKIQSMGRDKQMVARKNNKKLLLATLIAELQEYVLSICKDDRELIFSSGFDLAEYRSQGKPSIEKLDVEVGLPGEATLRLSNIEGAKAYVFQYSPTMPTANTEWIGEGSSLRTFTFKGLISDKRYWFRSVAIGTGGQRAYSPIVSLPVH